MTNTITRKKTIVKAMIFAILMVFTFTLSACDSDELDYSDFRNDHLDTWADALDQDEDQYLIYYYGVGCSHCKTIKQEILSFAAENNAGVKVYFIESTEVPTEDYKAHPIYDPQTGEAIPGTPTVIVVNDGVEKQFLVGPTIIRDLMDKINEGTYGFIK